MGKFNRSPEQPHHLIAFSKSRNDLQNINYAQAKAVMSISNENTDIALPSNMMNIADSNDISAKPFKQKEETEGALLDNETEEDEEDNDAMYGMDGNETTAPGLIAQLQMQDVSNLDQFDYKTPQSPNIDIDEDDDAQSFIMNDNESIAFANPLMEHD